MPPLTFSFCHSETHLAKLSSCENTPIKIHFPRHISLKKLRIDWGLVKKYLVLSNHSMLMQRLSNHSMLMYGKSLIRVSLTVTYC